MLLSIKITLFIVFAFHDLSVICEIFEDVSLVNWIKGENYTVEDHEVLTEDDHILILHRIPPKLLEHSTPVYLQHGLLSSSDDWILTGKNDSLAFFLWDNGFDVWLGNARGNTYSKNHTSFSMQDPKFWNFTFHEVGVHDAPSFIQYINNLTKKKIFYVGHSMGCSIFSVMAIRRPEVAKYIRAMIALAPAPYEYHVELPHLRTLSRNWQELWHHPKKYGLNQYLSMTFFSDLTSDKSCNVSLSFSPTICGTINVLEGLELKKNTSPFVIESTPSTSLKLFIHWLQHMEVNEFREFDYGREENLRIYGKPTPPKYDLTKIQIPVALFYSEDDEITPAEDVLHFYDQVPHKLGIYKIETSYAHTDFLRGPNVTKLVNEPILKIFRSLM